MRFILPMALGLLAVATACSNGEDAAPEASPNQVAAAASPTAAPTPTAVPTVAPPPAPSPTTTPANTPPPAVPSTPTSAAALRPLVAPPATLFGERLVAVPCDTVGTSRSVRGEATSIRFVNGGAGPLDLFWVDYAGGLVPYGSIAPGVERRQTTSVGHPWALHDLSGECVSVYVATAASVATSGWLASVPEAAPAFYTKALDAQGIWIVASDVVSDRALHQAARGLDGMLVRADLRSALASFGAYVAVIGREQGVTDLPEYRHLNSDTRGFGGSLANGGVTSAGEENILCLGVDRYLGESILVHEFAHTIMNVGLSQVAPDLYDRIFDAYASAIARGLWGNTYAATDVEEYWAEGVQGWFDTNATALPTNGIHNHVGTRAALQSYDIQLADILTEVFPTDWRYSCP